MFTISWVPRSLKYNFRIFQSLHKVRMWWYNIFGYNKGSVSHLLRLDLITSGSILPTVKLVAMKRGYSELILTVKRTECREFIGFFGRSIEADPSRVVKKNIYLVHIGYIPTPQSKKLHISRHHLEKQFNLQLQNLFLYQLTKNISVEIAPHISSALRDLQLGNIFCCFRRI